MSLVAVMLYDFQNRKFLPRECKVDEIVQEVRHVEDYLLRWGKKQTKLRVKLLKDKHNKTWGILDKVFKIYTAWLVLSSCTFACVWVCHHVFLYLFCFFLFCFFKSVSLSSERFCKSKPQTNHDSSAAVQNTVTKLYRDKRKGQFGRWK